MARAHSADVPSFDSYPAPEPVEAATSRESRDWSYEPVSDEFRGAPNQRLNQTAEQIGETMGRVVAMARAARQRIESARSDASAGLKQQVEAMSEQARERLDGWREIASERIDGLRAVASERLDDLRDKTERGIACGREQAAVRVDQARRYARANPEKVIGGALLAGLAVGIGLRIWNSSRRSNHV